MTGNGFYIPPIKMVKLVDGLRHCFIYAVFVYAYIDYIDMYPLVNEHNYGKSPFLMGKSTISMAIFHSFLYVYQRVYIDTYGYCIRTPVERSAGAVFAPAVHPIGCNFKRCIWHSSFFFTVNTVFMIIYSTTPAKPWSAEPLAVI